MNMKTNARTNIKSKNGIRVGAAFVPQLSGKKYALPGGRITISETEARLVAAKINELIPPNWVMPKPLFDASSLHEEIANIRRRADIKTGEKLKMIDELRNKTLAESHKVTA